MSRGIRRMPARQGLRSGRRKFKTGFRHLERAVLTGWHRADTEMALAGGSAEESPPRHSGGSRSCWGLYFVGKLAGRPLCPVP